GQQRRDVLGGVDMVRRNAAIALAAATCIASATPAAAEPPRWLGDDLPLPLQVKTPQDIGFKSAAERQYLIFNLMAGGKLAYQRGDYAIAVEKWETLLRINGLDPQIEKAVAPFLVDARTKVAAGHTGSRVEPRPEPEPVAQQERTERSTEARPRATVSVSRRVSSSSTVSVSGTVSGGGQIGPGGAVLWLKRLDGSMPRIVPPPNQVVTQREKTFLPHVLAVPTGTTVQFRNDDRIYHNVFS